MWGERVLTAASLAEVFDETAPPKDAATRSSELTPGLKKLGLE